MSWVGAGVAAGGGGWVVGPFEVSIHMNLSKQCFFFASFFTPSCEQTYWQVMTVMMRMMWRPET